MNETIHKDGKIQKPRSRMKNPVEETLYLGSIPQMRESIVEGGKTPIEECMTDIEW